MSLVIAINGQFKDYIRPPKKHAAGIKPLAPVSTDFRHQVEDAPGEEGAPQRRERYKQSINKYKRVENGVPGRREIHFADEIMTHPVVCLEHHQGLQDARMIMQRHAFHHLPIMQGNVMVGIVSDRDLLAAGERNPSPSTIMEVATLEIIAARMDTEIRVIAAIMLEEKISALPIIDDKNQLKGIITKTDILECVMRNMPLEILI